MKPRRGLWRGSVALALLGVALGTTTGVGPSAAPAVTATTGLHSVSSARLYRGVTYQHLETVRPPEDIHVVTLRPDAPVTAMASLSNNRIAELPVESRLERTSHNCHRHGCVAGINADYFCTNVYCRRDIWEPEGGVVSLGRMLRSPYSNGTQEKQLMLNRRGCPLPPGRLGWRGTVTAGGISVSLAGVQAPR